MSKRKHYGLEAWETARALVEQPDGLPVVNTKGIWTAKKLFFLCLYLEQVVRGMSGNSAFPGGLTYLDLFCGCGVSVVQEPGKPDRRYPGSSVVAASMQYVSQENIIRKFDRLILVDANKEHLDASIVRSRRAGYSGSITPLCGDINAVIGEVVRLIPVNSLNIAFVDPYSLDIHYDTLAQLAGSRALDLIILFSDRIDLARNVRQNYYPNQDSKLDLFLGKNSGWKKRYAQLANQAGASVFELFADIYLEQLAKLGYTSSQSWPLEGEQGPMFRLVFASKNKLGLKFCDIARGTEFGGQRGLFTVD